MKNNFFIVVLFYVFSILFSSCASVQHNRITDGINNIEGTSLEKLKMEDLSISNTVKAEKNYTKVWFLFIPFGNKTEATRRERVYLQACSDNSIDGILQPKYETKKFVIPLILFTYVSYNTTVFGKGYNIKTTNTTNNATVAEKTEKQKEVVKPKELVKEVVNDVPAFKRGDYVLFDSKKCVVVSVVDKNVGFIRELGTRQNKEVKLKQLTIINLSQEEVDKLEIKK